MSLALLTYKNFAILTRRLCKPQLRVCSAKTLMLLVVLILVPEKHRRGWYFLENFSGWRLALS